MAAPSGDFHALIVNRTPELAAHCACGWRNVSTLMVTDDAVNAWTDHMVDCGAIITQEPVSA